MRETSIADPHQHWSIVKAVTHRQYKFISITKPNSDSDWLAMANDFYSDDASTSLMEVLNKIELEQRNWMNILHCQQNLNYDDDDHVMVMVMMTTMMIMRLCVDE